MGSAERDEIIRRFGGKFSDFYRKQRGCNEHKTWTLEEEQKIIDFFQKEMPIENIAKEMERTPTAIAMRLEKLGFMVKI